MRLRPLLLLCALSPALALAQAEPPAPPPPPPPVAAAESAAPSAEAAAPASAVAAAEAPPPKPWPRWGVKLGAGVPQAATLDLLYRPIPWLLLSAGPTWDYAGFGYHGGVVLSPIRWAISPTLGLEAGKLNDVDLNRFTSVEAGLKPLLQRVGLRYVATTIGLEIGSQRGFAFDLRLGLAWLWGDTHGTGSLTSSGGVNGQNDAQVSITNPKLRASAPTVQLGFQYFF
jgi:hypothetical protein